MERRRRRQRHARADGFGRGGAATAWAAAAPFCHERAVCAARARSGAGKHGGAGKRGGGDGGGGGSGTRGRTDSDGAEQRPPGRPLLRLPRARRLRSSSAVRRREAWRRGEARLSVSGGGRHVARREDDKCASHGSLFIGQSSGTQVETEHGRRKAGGAEAGVGGGTRLVVEMAESGRWPPFCSVLASLCPSQLTAITLPPPLARDAPSSDGAEGASAQS